MRNAAIAGTLLTAFAGISGLVTIPRRVTSESITGKGSSEPVFQVPVVANGVPGDGKLNEPEKGEKEKMVGLDPMDRGSGGI
jgi:hypothetical protein